MLYIFLNRLRRDESGAVTVDWVVLTAGIVGLGIAVITTIAAGATDNATGLGARLSTHTTMSF